MFNILHNSAVGYHQTYYQYNYNIQEQNQLSDRFNELTKRYFNEHVSNNNFANQLKRLQSSSRSIKSPETIYDSFDCKLKWENNNKNTGNNSNTNTVDSELYRSNRKKQKTCNQSDSICNQLIEKFNQSQKTTIAL